MGPGGFELGVRVLNAKVRLRPWPNAAKAQRKQRKAKCAEFGFNALQIHSFGIVPSPYFS